MKSTGANHRLCIATGERNLRKISLFTFVAHLLLPSVAFREDSNGWQSSCQGPTPHTLVLKIQHHDEERMMHRLEILCHEYKVPEKVEIILASGCADEEIPSLFDECESILHLGYITMDPNERSDYQDRELKSIPIGKPADFIRLVIPRCHKNSLNPDNQVGIVGIKVLGVEAAIDLSLIHI